MTSTHTPGPWPEFETFDLWKEKRERMRRIALDALPEDAHLISSAPDLLAALERLAHPMADDEDLDYAREVIARAKGL